MAMAMGLPGGVGRGAVAAAGGSACHHCDDHPHELQLLAQPGGAAVQGHAQRPEPHGDRVRGSVLQGGVLDVEFLAGPPEQQLLAVAWRAVAWPTLRQAGWDLEDVAWRQQRACSTARSSTASTTSHAVAVAAVAAATASTGGADRSGFLGRWTSAGRNRCDFRRWGDLEAAH